MEQCGYTVSKVSIIYLDRDYVKEGDIDPQGLLLEEDVTDQVNAGMAAIGNEINDALTLLENDLDTTQACSCLRKTRSNHCDSFHFFNGELPEYSVYQIGGIREAKLNELLDMSVFELEHVPDDFDLSLRNQLQVRSKKQDEPLIDPQEIREKLSGLIYPLHFIDYETYPTAVPKLDGMRPHQHLTFQVSIHTLTKEGELTHYEYLAKEITTPEDMLRGMAEFTGQSGTFVSWHASFEIGRNREMMEQCPEYEPYLEYINNNMFDLERLFFTGYVDYRFKGRTSIKSVLPVLVPTLSYDRLQVRDGTMALDAWGRLVQNQNASTEEVMETRQNLLEYCKLDTLDMVEIYRFIRNLV